MENLCDRLARVYVCVCLMSRTTAFFAFSFIFVALSRWSMQIHFTGICFRFSALFCTVRLLRSFFTNTLIIEPCCSRSWGSAYKNSFVCASVDTPFNSIIHFVQQKAEGLSECFIFILSCNWKFLSSVPTLPDPVLLEFRTTSNASMFSVHIFWLMTENMWYNKLFEGFLIFWIKSLDCHLLIYILIFESQQNPINISILHFRSSIIICFLSNAFQHIAVKKTKRATFFLFHPQMNANLFHTIAHSSLVTSTFNNHLSTIHFLASNFFWL